MVILKSKRKIFDGELKIKLNGKRRYLTFYFDIKIDENLTQQHHKNHLFIKLNIANGLLFKVRKFVGSNILRSTCFSIFKSYLNYFSLVWAQNTITGNLLLILQKNALRIINFQLRNSHTSLLFKRS